MSKSHSDFMDNGRSESLIPNKEVEQVWKQLH